jgi:hypothetical protein
MLREEHGLRVCEKRVLRKICGPKRKDKQATGENCIMKSFMICTPHQMLLGFSNGLDWQCMWHVWGEKKCIQDFDRET